MGIAQKIDAAKVKQRLKTVCKLMQVTIDPKLSKEDVDSIIKVINATPESINYIPNTKLSAVLRQEGYDVSPSAVDRHKNKTCSCYRIGK
jgi:hypothetical protein